MPFSASHNVRLRLIGLFPGQTVCVALHCRGNKSKLIFILCRRISHQADDTILNDASDYPLLDNVNIRLTSSRYHLDHCDVEEGEMLHLLPFCNVVSNLRQLKSIHNALELPDHLHTILFGTSFAEMRQLPEKQPPRSRSELLASLENLSTVRSRVDNGCLTYIDSLSAVVCDRSQRRALLTTLGEMGEMHPNSSSLSLILGPPGTGK